MAFEATKPYYQVSASNRGFTYTLSQNNAPLTSPCVVLAFFVPNHQHLRGWPSYPAEGSASSFLAGLWLKGTGGIALAFSRIQGGSL